MMLVRLRMVGAFLSTSCATDNPEAGSDLCV